MTIMLYIHDIDYKCQAVWNIKVVLWIYLTQLTTTMMYDIIHAIDLVLFLLSHCAFMSATSYHCLHGTEHEAKSPWL